MIKNILKTRRFVALQILALVLFGNLIPTANAGVLDGFLFGKNEIIISNTLSSANQYLNPAIIQNTIPNDQNITILNDNFLVANQSPVKISGSEVVIKNTIAREILIPITAYSSTVDQTDDDPFTTAMGTHVRDGVVASNFLPFGTKIKIPQIFGDKVFTVEDRMNKRYLERVDVWFPDREGADNFGLRVLKIQILES